MKPLAHVGVSGLVSILVGAYFKSFGCAILSFVAGVFVDLDHVLDYYLNHGFTLQASKIYYACLEFNLKRIYILLHSYEVIILFWVWLFLRGQGNLYTAIAIGMTQHVVFDQLTNPLDGLGYFLTYRIIKGFDKNLLIKERNR
ncbi:MAG: hypothetical protein A2987_02730 [Omnitrophica bacterium RIFCSPLOWO2_01_FULL_45_10]|nr:MAG: hypothetical protein A2987_02730 [Omnitrophica bacterium RIFCSPLOWO2_01_FULL_45_10]